MTSPPASVRRIAADVVGDVREVVPLAGMSGASVLALVGAGGTVVAKRAGATETSAYTSDVLTSAGVRMPRLLGTTDGWLVLEHVPHALPRERWGSDPQVLQLLVRVHTTSGPPGTDLFLPRWDDTMHRAALARLGSDLDEALSVVRLRAAPLLAPVSVISGDPNPLNWGVTADGEVVLMDWERLGRGHPTLDLAIALPGLPSRADARRTAACYRSAGGVDVDPVDVLVAKVWSVVEFTADSGEDPSRLAVVARIKEELAPWLAAVVGLLDLSP